MQLLWNVGEEINVKGYYVEASIDGANFSNLGYIAASNKDIYSLNYLDKISQTMYFRVRNIDFDGKSKYTPIIKVYGKDAAASAFLEIYPVPSNDRITIQHKLSAEKAIITLYTTDGKIVLHKNVQLNTYQTQVNIGILPSGTYLVKYDDGTGTLQSKVIYKN